MNWKGKQTVFFHASLNKTKKKKKEKKETHTLDI